MNLNEREKIVILVAVMLTVVLLAFPMVINPVKKKLKRIDRQVQAGTTNLAELQRLKKEYNVIQGATKGMEAKIAKSAKNVTLPSLLERIANITDLKEKMTGLKTHETVRDKNFQENGVEITLKNVTLDELMNFVYKLESLPYMIKIKGFKIKTTYAKGPKYINLTLLVSLFTEA